MPTAPETNGRAGVLLDVDGTLVDTNYLHTLAWSRALPTVGRWAPMHAIHRLVGMGGDQLVPELFGHPVDGAEAAWRSQYQPLRNEIRPFPGAVDLVRAIHESGLGVVLATSSPADLLDEAIEILSVADVLDATTNADDVASSKPDPDVFSAAMQSGGIDPRRAIAVGDSIWDVRAARAAGIACIALESGGFSRHELSEDGAVAVYRDAESLASQLWTSPIALLLR